MLKFVSTDAEYIARSASFFWWKRVYTGKPFVGLTDDQKRAVLAHETYHVMAHHTEMRIVALFCPFVIPWLCKKQEFDADECAAWAGYRAELIEMLEKSVINDGPYHPTNFERIQRLKNFDPSPSRMYSPGPA